MSTEHITPDVREVNALVLTSCFGWKWESRISLPRGKRLTALHAGEDDPLGYVPTNYNRDVWQPSDADEERFDDWDRGNIKQAKDGFGRIDFNLPNFCGDRNLVAEFLLPKVRELNIVCEFGHVVCQSVQEPLYELDHKDCFPNYFVVTEILLCTPVQLTEAFLRTLAVWPAEWKSIGRTEKEA